MGLFDWFTGTKRPEGGVTPRSPQEVYQSLLAVNRDDAPFVVRDGSPEGVDLISEWRIMDPVWYEHFKAFSVTKYYQIRMRLDPSKQEVRSVDRTWEVDWVRGFPQFVHGAETGRGQVKKVEKAWSLGRDENGKLELKDKATFSMGELKSPLQKSVIDLGWTWRGVAVGKL
ncbi:hypothetical protein FHX42_000089 [Saccharopolyspora lacisalsi]|uniref:Uncharacterized protein n=1 Tax=Halosaccharopolyspora lacisalsi TaxID=1000566 RepID=A0A839DP38_9PSEU|nr:hypothetical protein [Halosaccharopolyspora lacisalsi]MBA8822760.1 hypothetical protein [Halosaccharopolyspora lacisalsi]